MVFHVGSFFRHGCTFGTLSWSRPWLRQIIPFVTAVPSVLYSGHGLGFAKSYLSSRLYLRYFILKKANPPIPPHRPHGHPPTGHASQPPNSVGAKPTVLIYKVGWFCPYCSAALHYLSSVLLMLPVYGWAAASVLVNTPLRSVIYQPSRRLFYAPLRKPARFAFVTPFACKSLRFVAAKAAPKACVNGLAQNLRASGFFLASRAGLMRNGALRPDGIHSAKASFIHADPSLPRPDPWQQGLANPHLRPTF